MAKWDYLVESDRELRELQRKWRTSGRQVDFMSFLSAWLRSGASAEDWGLDPSSRYSKDFDDLVDYCRSKLKGELIPLRGIGRRRYSSGPDAVFTVDFHLNDDPQRFQIARIHYPTVGVIPAYAQRFLNDGIVRHTKLWQTVVGWAQLEQTTPEQPQPYQRIRVLMNKALTGVFGPKGRLR